VVPDEGPAAWELSQDLQPSDPRLVANEQLHPRFEGLEIWNLNFLKPLKLLKHPLTTALATLALAVPVKVPVELPMGL